MKARLPKQNQGGAQNMNAMIRQAQKMQDEISELQEEIEAREFSATAGGGASDSGAGAYRLSQNRKLRAALGKEGPAHSQDVPGKSAGRDLFCRHRRKDGWKLCAGRADAAGAAGAARRKKCGREIVLFFTNSLHFCNLT